MRSAWRLALRRLRILYAGKYAGEFQNENHLGCSFGSANLTGHGGQDHLRWKFRQREVNLTRDELIRRYPNASESFIKANLPARYPRQVAKLESNLGNAPLETKEVQRPVGERVLVRVTSIRKRLLDEDNLCEKYHVDLCRYAGIIADDSPEQVKIEVCQFKTKRGEDEVTVVEVFQNQ